MQLLLYDGTFTGFLTVIFECYAHKLEPLNICREDNFQDNLFVDRIKVESDETKATRVWQGLRKKLHPKNPDLPYKAFLSEEEAIEMRLYRFMKRVFDSPKRIDTDYGDPDVLALKKLERKVMQESMRVLEFLRFQQTKDDIYFAPIEPQFDVLPFTIKHFKERFADQKWLIYDLKRDYGYYYNLKKVDEIVLAEKTFSTVNGKLRENQLEEDEMFYQTLWQNYFKHINIKERKNAKLQRQHMPHRYWKFLPEKNQ